MIRVKELARAESSMNCQMYGDPSELRKLAHPSSWWEWVRLLVGTLGGERNKKEEVEEEDAGFMDLIKWADRMGLLNSFF